MGPRRYQSTFPTYLTVHSCPNSTLPSDWLSPSSCNKPGAPLLHVAAHSVPSAGTATPASPPPPLVSRAPSHLQDCSPGHTAKEGPHLVRTGASRGYSRAAAPVWCCSRGIMGSSGSLSCGAREVRLLCAWLGGARHCPSSLSLLAPSTLSGDLIHSLATNALMLMTLQFTPQS